MARIWNIMKIMLSMLLYAIARETNYIVAVVFHLIQFSILSLFFQEYSQLNANLKIQILIESEINVLIWLAIFFFGYSPIREYIERNWRRINIAVKDIFNIIKKLWK